MRRFRSPNAGQTSLTLQHSTSPRSGYRPALGANRDGYPMGGIPIRTGFKSGGKVYERGYPKKPSKRVGGDKKRPGKWGKSAYWKAKQRKEDISFRDAMTEKGSIPSGRKMKKGPHSTMAGYGAEGQRTLNRRLKAAGHDQGDYNPYNPKSKKNPLGHKGTYYKGSDSRLKARKGGWIQSVNKSIKKRGTKGKCTPITKKGCTGRAKALAKTFKKMAKKRKGK